MKKTALISVYDKKGILDFALKLTGLGFRLISTGGTFKYLKENNVSVESVESITGFPEILNGRVKTLHPKIFAGILSETDNPKHKEEMKIQGLDEINIVVVNLYPFQETIKKENVSTEEAIEQIDIGGVSLIRAAAKNFKYVNVITDPEQYSNFIDEYKNGKISFGFSRRLAYKAFSVIADYDVAIQNYFSTLCGNENIPSWIKTGEAQHLRYGENPHQKAFLLKENFDDIFKVLHGKELSYNNMLDIDAAYSIIKEFENDKPTCAIIKHGNPSGIATSNDLSDSYIKAFATDTASPFGGIIIFNKALDIKTAEESDKIFSEIILAPEFDDDALKFLEKKKNRRLVIFKYSKENFEFKKITGGVLYQERDNIIFDKNNIKVVTKKSPTPEQLEDMYFAYKVVKHTKSNAVIFVKNLQTVAIGGGQPSRIDSTKIAISKAKQFNMELKGSVAASDAFFPFADGVLAIAEAGAVCVVQPGGSVRDDEVIKTADEHNLCMIFTGYRHFRH